MSEVNQQQSLIPVSWQRGFLEMLPCIEHHIRVALRSLKGAAKDEAICEVVASCLCAYRRLYEQNALDRAFATALVRYGVRNYFRGRRVGTSQCSHDLYSVQAQTKVEVKLQSVGTPRDQRVEWMECLADIRRMPVPDQVHFRIEFPRWLAMQTNRNRQIAMGLLLGHSALQVARKQNISPGRVSQIRRELYESWKAFNSEMKPI
jgi:hypothetical protein